LKRDVSYVAVISNQGDEEEDADDAEVHSELTQLTETLRENEETSCSVTSQLQVAEAGVREGTKHVC